MSQLGLPRPRPRSPRSTAPGRLWRVLAAVALVAGSFGLGLALGQALGDNPEPGLRTDVRTLRPVTLPPERSTVTVTVTTP